jgi:S1-C subfamily serine protease
MRVPLDGEVDRIEQHHQCHVAGARGIAHCVYRRDDSSGRSRTESGFGFELGSPYVNVGTPNEDEVPTIMRLDSAGPFARAGLAEGDILVDIISTGTFYLSLSLSAPGDSKEVTVVAGGDGPRIGVRPERRVAVIAP